MFNSSFVKDYDLHFYDFSTSLLSNHENEKISNIVIVDIDEKSLKELGQWPWPRIILAQLLDKISAAHASAIGLDILLPEEDRTSPIHIQEFYKKYFNLNLSIEGLDKNYLDNDLILADAIRDTDTILSIFLTNTQSLSNSCNNIFSISTDIKMDKLNKYSYHMCNNEIIQKSSSKQGFVNKYIDSDGVLRKVPLMAEHNGLTIPSLPLAVLLSINNDIQYNDNTIDFLTHRVKLSQDSSVLLNYYPKSWYQKISAVDILSKELDKDFFAGKIVLVGSSSLALHDRVVIPEGREIAGIQVNATMIANLLDDSLRVQPEIYKIINFLISFLLSVILIIILLKESRIWIVILLLFVVLSTFIVNLYTLDNGSYISIGYLLIPFLLNFFVINLFSIIIDVVEKKIFAEELNQSQVALFDSMVHVAEAHDVETGKHIIRTKEYVRLLAQSIFDRGLYKEYLSNKKIKIMYQTSALHDIGKVGISDAILKKNAKLTEDEFTIMKTHSQLGKNIIDRAISSYKENDFFITARNISYYHHEKYDGTGYPRGLKGGLIPLEARIMALADVYDALMSKRVYKEAFSYEKTKEIILSGSSKHFDPIVVEAFLDKEKEFKYISNKYLDTK